MRYFVVFLIIGTIGLIIPDAYAELDQSILEPFETNDLVIIGKVVQVNTIISENKTEYGIQVQEYLKNQKPFDMITAILDSVKPQGFPEHPLDYYNKPYFEEGNQVLAYLKQEGGTFKLSPYSFTLIKKGVAGPPIEILPTGPHENYFSQGDEIIISGVIKKAHLFELEREDKDSNLQLIILNEKGDQIVSKKLTASLDGSYKFPFQNKGDLRIPGTYSWEVQFGYSGWEGEFVVEPNLKLWSPLKQFESGTPIDEIQCKRGLILITKSSDDSPACVKPQTKHILIERGWTKTNNTYQNIILTNNFPNIKDRDIRVIVGQTENQDESLSVRVLEKTTRSEPADNIMFQKIEYLSMRTMTKNDGFFIVSSTHSDKPLLEKYPTEPTLQTLYVGNTKEQIGIYFPVEIPLDASVKDEVIIFNYSLPYMLPDFDKTYSFALASFSPLEIELPSNAKIINSEVRVHNGFWLFDKSNDGQLSYKTEEYSLFYGYDKPSIPVKSVVIYNIKFEL